MFAIENIKSGEKILIWGGEYVDKETAEKAREKGKLVMQWDENIFSIEYRGEDLGYFINHSCDSNSWTTDTFTLSAKREIPKGEEITADYALWEADENYISKWDCRCGSPLCRGKITGKNYKLLEIQDRYKNHFSPLINKRIENL